MVFLGVNIDHVATVRNARGTQYPDPVAAALLAEDHGADGITAHLREDRRHIRDEDMARLKAGIRTRLNMEMANTAEMVHIACKLKPYMVTLVPERREEVTTEGGLDVLRYETPLTETVKTLQDSNILVSLFIEPDARQLEAAHRTGARIIEFHTGRYCEAFEQRNQQGNPSAELNRLLSAAAQCHEMGITVNAGHGLNVENVQPVLQMAGLHELNIGHSLIADALFLGLGPAVRRMKNLIA